MKNEPPLFLRRPSCRLLVVLAVHHGPVAVLKVLRHRGQLGLAVFVAPKTPAGPGLDRILGARKGRNFRKIGKDVSFSFHGYFHGVLRCFTMF